MASCWPIPYFVYRIIPVNEYIHSSSLSPHQKIEIRFFLGLNIKHVRFLDVVYSQFPLKLSECNGNYQLLHGFGMNHPGDDHVMGSGNSMNDSSSTGRSMRGRPKTARNLSRPNRIVTFVTDKERELLERVALEEERSMAAVVHRIIKAHFENL